MLIDGKCDRCHTEKAIVDFAIGNRRPCKLCLPCFEKAIEASREKATQLANNLIDVIFPKEGVDPG